MKLLASAILSIVLLTAITTGIRNVVDHIGKERVTYTPAFYIISNEEAKRVMRFHGVLRIWWNDDRKDFVFLRDGKILRTNAFKLLRKG